MFMRLYLLGGVGGPGELVIQRDCAVGYLYVGLSIMPGSYSCRNLTCKRDGEVLISWTSHCNRELAR